MRKSLEARHYANQQVARILEKFKEEYKSVTVLVDAVKEFTALINNVATLVTKVDGIPSKTAGNKNLCRLDLMSVTHRVSNVLKAYATVNKDQTLSDFIISSRSELKNRLRHQQLLDYSKGVSERIGTMTEVLAPYGLTEDIKKQLDEEIEEFKSVVLEPRQLINERKTNNELIVDYIGDAAELLEDKIDPLMELFNEHPLFYPEYKAARMIINAASRKQKTESEINEA
ncbi:hypothetical protein E9993_17430 [Labilibacter sediminis]|nr:hypothetical protein E9993_17430 [Labilibacter sediminis]